LCYNIKYAISAFTLLTGCAVDAQDASFLRRKLAIQTSDSFCDE